MDIYIPSCWNVLDIWEWMNRRGLTQTYKCSLFFKNSILPVIL